MLRVARRILAYLESTRTYVARTTLSWQPLNARGIPSLGDRSDQVQRDEEIVVGGDGAIWTLKADLKVPVSASAWLLVEGPGYRQAQVSAAGATPLVFSLLAGSPGTYRFWIVPTRIRRQTADSLARHIRKALVAGEFNIDT